jgi:cytochrome c oxidase subunit 3
MAAQAEMAHGDAHGHDGPHHDYHLVDPSPWPATGALAALFLTGGTVLWMHGHDVGYVVTAVGFLGVLATMFVWWRDVLREGITGHHKDVVSRGLRVGMALFITTEVMFFVAFFWAFFWGAINQPMLYSVSWPPAGLAPVAAWDIPFLNTMILLLSGATVTWAHHAVREGDQDTAFKALLLTACLGVTFTSFQAYEYVHSISEGFTIHKEMYGSTFYMATGFHGFHVIVGTTFLLVCAIRAYYHTFQADKHVGLEAAAWYWHFVDVVWLFLFVWVYWWGGSLQFVTTPVIPGGAG